MPGGQDGGTIGGSTGRAAVSGMNRKALGKGTEHFRGTNHVLALVVGRTHGATIDGWIIDIGWDAGEAIDIFAPIDLFLGWTRGTTLTGWGNGLDALTAIDGRTAYRGAIADALAVSPCAGRSRVATVFAL